ncbi:Hexosyltransferase [Meloidogyne graminicola]|uniref:Hexosyltransferase n=1 Tax=Meloidogyne graminicola TaxID=189291 RepID=A0A8S9ZF03_9BILA|nr:Hexosyltransferase [Meloidogyne graminicola]
MKSKINYSKFSPIHNWKNGRKINVSKSFRIYGSVRFISYILIRLLLLLTFITFLYILFYSKQFQSFFNKNNKKKEFAINFKNAYIPYSMDIPDNNLNKACPDNTKLLILIMTRIDAFKNRDGIRKTWLKDAVAGTITKFLIADSPSKIELSKKEEANQKLEALKREKQLLQLEQMQNKDLIFLYGIEDSYANLHFKWLAALQWQQAFCPKTKFIMKTDDDTIVHLPRLNHWIDKKFSKAMEKNKAIYFGWIISGVGPIRDPKHKWYVSENVYPGKSYPPYMQGATYVASREAINAIIPFTNKVIGFNMDDVLFTGVLAELANVTRSDHKEMFRVGNGLDKEEKCEDRIPYVTALYGAAELENFKNIYTKLKTVKCP